MRRALIDVNVLLALLDYDHMCHEAVDEWLVARGEAGWASCPITQNGFVRIASQPAYTGSFSTAAAIRRLATGLADEYHAFWPDDISIADRMTAEPSRIHGPRQITDIYLLALAVRNEGCFVTMDRSVPLSAVPGATEDHIAFL